MSWEHERAVSNWALDNRDKAERILKRRGWKKTDGGSWVSPDTLIEYRIETALLIAAHEIIVKAVGII